MQKKPWYKSKITLLGILLGIIGVTDLTFGWLTGQGVTEDQIAAVQIAAPSAIDQIKAAEEGNNWFGIITVIGGFFSSIWRVWFTKTVIE